MTAKLRISEDFDLSMDILCEKIATLARTGMGKSYTGSVIAEELLKHKQQICAIDLTDAWWGLRSSADGLSPGYEVYIFGGPHGDIELNPNSGALMADTIVETGISAVLSLKSFESNAEETRFVEAFMTRLYRKNRTPIHVFLDEGDQFAPQFPMPEERRCLGAVERIFKRGRINGIGGTILSQRSASVSKNVLSQSGILIAGQTTDKRDKKAIVEWCEGKDVTVEQSQELLQSLPSLRNGTVWVCWPQMEIFRQVHIRERETFDSGKSPKPGEVRREPKRLASVDLDKLRAQMAETVEKAKREDPKALQQRIKELEIQLAKKPPAASQAEPKTEYVDRHVLRGSELMRVERILDRIDRLPLAKFQADLREAVEPVRAELVKANQPVTINKLAEKPFPREHYAPHVAAHRSAPKSIALHSEDGSQRPLKAGEIRMLQIIAALPDLTKEQLATLSVFAVSGGTFGTYLSVLKARGFYADTEGHLELTDAGLDYLTGSFRPLEPTHQLVDRWKRTMKAGEGKMLDILVDEYPKSISKQDLGERSGYEISGGTFGTYLSTLKRGGLIEVKGDQVAASGTLFLSGGKK